MNRKLLATLSLAGAIILGGCAEVRTLNQQVEFLQKPLKPLPGVATVEVAINPTGTASPSVLAIEGKKMVSANGDVLVTLTTGEPEITKAEPGTDVYVEYLRSANGQYLVDAQGNYIEKSRTNVYWIDVEVSTNNSFEMKKKDGTILESQSGSMSTAFVYGKKPEKLLGGAVTLWSGGDWTTNPSWLLAQWQIQGPVLVKQKGRELRAAAVNEAAMVIEENYSQGMRKANVPIAFWRDDKDDQRLVNGFQGVNERTPEGFKKAIDSWQSVIDDKQVDQDGEPVTSPLQRACAHLNVASVHYIKEEWGDALKRTRMAAMENSQYDEGFFEGLFKGNKKRMGRVIEQLNAMIRDRAMRDAANAKEQQTN